MLRIPVTASNIAEWVRLAANAVNGLIRASEALDARAAALEAFAGAPVAESFTFTPVALPGSPVDGMTVLDIADGVIKTWYSGAWHAHY
jgi:hypothetical protein